MILSCKHDITIYVTRQAMPYFLAERPGSLAAMEQGRRPQRNGGQVHPFVMLLYYF